MDERTRQQQAIAALRQQRDTLLAALKAAPSAFGEYDNADDFVWDTYRRWWQGQRQAAIAAVEGEQGETA